MKIRKLAPTSVGITLSKDILYLAQLKVGDNVVLDVQQGIVTITKRTKEQ
jgi:hypothetical protein